MDAVIERALRAAGAQPERSGAAAILRQLPPGLNVSGVSGTGGFYVIGDPPADAEVLESGTLAIEGRELPIHRCAEPPALRPHGEKVAEGRGNLGRRAGWFRKRSS
jgi:hypothetical protein